MSKLLSCRSVMLRCFLDLHHGSKVQRTFYTLASTWEKSGTKFQMRRPLKVFSPDGTPLPLKETQLEHRDQGMAVASEAMNVLPRWRNSPKNNRISENLRQDTNIPDEEPEDDDPLPPGLSLENLPRFKKINGWEKENKHLRKIRHALSKQTKDKNTVLLEGKRIIIDAMKAGLYPKIFIFSRVNLLLGFPFDLSKRLAMYQVPYNQIKQWSDLTTHPGFIAAFDRQEMMSAVNSKGVKDCVPLTLVLDNVRGPDNMGAILRVAAAVGCRKVVTMSGCVDVWQPKVLRAGAGANFKVPVASGVQWHKIHEHLPEHAQVILADISRSDCLDKSDLITQEEQARKLAQLQETCMEFMFQDDNKEEEDSNLNSILREVKDDEQALSLKLDEAKREEATNPVVKGYGDFSYYEEELVQEYSSLPFASKPFHEFQTYEGYQEIVIIIGGETEGVSGRAKKLVHNRLGERIFVPLLNDMDSLNVACATSVILFEIRKHLKLAESIES